MPAPRFSAGITITVCLCHAAATTSRGTESCHATWIDLWMTWKRFQSQHLEVTLGIRPSLSKQTNSFLGSSTSSFNTQNHWFAFRSNGALGTWVASTLATPDRPWYGAWRMECSLDRVWSGSETGWCTTWSSLVGGFPGTWLDYFSIYWLYWDHHPDWLIHIFQRAWNHQPDQPRAILVQKWWCNSGFGGFPMIVQHFRPILHVPAGRAVCFIFLAWHLCDLNKQTLEPCNVAPETLETTWKHQTWQERLEHVGTKGRLKSKSAQKWFRSCQKLSEREINHFNDLSILEIMCFRSCQKFRRSRSIRSDPMLRTFYVPRAAVERDPARSWWTPSG